VLFRSEFGVYFVAFTISNRNNRVLRLAALAEPKKNGLSALIRIEVGLCFVAFAFSKTNKRVLRLAALAEPKKNGLSALIRIEVGLCFVGFAFSKRGNRISELATVAATVSEVDSNWIWHRATWLPPQNLEFTGHLSR